MQISDAVEVIEVSSSESANKKLSEGCKLLAVLPGIQTTVPGSPLSTRVVYVLGKGEDKVHQLDDFVLGAHATQP